MNAKVRRTECLFIESAGGVGWSGTCPPWTLAGSTTTAPGAMPGGSEREDGMGEEWTQVRQRAGPLVKECRYRRPALSKGDLPSVRREKSRIRALTRDACFRRTPVDRLELMLALFGWRASVYCLTFDPDHLPGSFQEVRRIWRNFLRAMRRWRKQSFDYVYVIEGRHGDHRYHIHLVLRDEDFSPAEVRFLWPGGSVDDAPLLLGPRDNYRRTARYFCKERTDGVVLPIGARTWVASRSLYRQLPPPEKGQAEQGEIPVPPDAAWAEENAVRNPFGAYRYAAYIEPNPLKTGRRIHILEI